MHSHLQACFLFVHDCMCWCGRLNYSSRVARAASMLWKNANKEKYTGLRSEKISLKKRSPMVLIHFGIIPSVCALKVAGDSTPLLLGGRPAFFMVYLPYHYWQHFLCKVHGRQRTSSFRTKVREIWKVITIIRGQKNSILDKKKKIYKRWLLSPSKSSQHPRSPWFWEKPLTLTFVCVPSNADLTSSSTRSEHFLLLFISLQLKGKDSVDSLAAGKRGRHYSPDQVSLTLIQSASQVPLPITLYRRR